MDPAEVNDRTSQVCASSNRTSASSASAAAKAQAKAEAACVHAPFAEREAKLKLEQAEREAKSKHELAKREAKQRTEEAKALLDKARLDAELGALALQTEAAAAMAQAEVLEAAEEQVRAPSTKASKMSLEREIGNRTGAYVKKQNALRMNSCHVMTSLHLLS